MQTYSVPDMSCGHCKMSIETALSALPGTGAVTVDLPGHQVTLTGPVAPAAVMAALAEIGFPATPVAAK